MQPAAASLCTRTPALGSSASSSLNRYLKRQPSLSRFSSTDAGTRSRPVSAAPPKEHHYQTLRPVRLNAVPVADRSPESVRSIKTRIDNLAKFWCPSDPSASATVSNGSESPTNMKAAVSKPIEKIIAEHRSLQQKGEAVLGSPKQKLGDKWKQYHGANDWEGLLDPLDGNLRREIVKYGDFVQASYNAMDFDPQSCDYGRCKFPEESTLLDNAGLCDSGYRVTKHLYTTSPLRLPDWVAQSLGLTDTAMRIFRRRSWVGFVAVCEDPAEIERLGRRDVVISFRGTVTPLEWAENLNCGLTTVDAKRDIKVSNGFWRLFTGKEEFYSSMAEDLVREIRRLKNKYAGEELSVTVTGHSLGAALAVLAAYTISEEVENMQNVTAFTFGGPRVGNKKLGRRMYEKGCRVLRVVNSNDVITKVPVALGTVKETKHGQEHGHGYCHVGRELKVKTKNSPYLKAEAERDMNCCHDLEAYLHLVDGYLSSQCPFRSAAKRDILRLLMNQRSNVLVKPSPMRSLSMRSLFPDNSIDGCDQSPCPHGAAVPVNFW